MFVPNEGALQLAMATDKRLWNDAFAKHVFITSQQNLMAILKMIEIAWRQYAQTENQIKIYGIAEELLKRVGEFVKRFDKVKKDIDTLAVSYTHLDVYKRQMLAYLTRAKTIPMTSPTQVPHHRLTAMPHLRKRPVGYKATGI